MFLIAGSEVMPFSSKIPEHIKPSVVSRLQKSARRDMLIGGMAIFFLISISIYFDLEIVENFYEFTRAYENHEFDDVFIALFWVGIGSSIYAIRRAKDIRTLNNEIVKHAYYDPITGLPNRILALDRLERQLLDTKRYGGQVVVVFIDFDDFKSVNDTYGHDVGDELIRKVGERLSNVVRGEETIARLGGDEFLLIAMFRDGLEDVPLMLSRLLSTQDQVFPVNNYEIQVKYSAGVAISPADGQTSIELIKAADIAMYRAKRKDCDRPYVYYSDCHNA